MPNTPTLLELGLSGFEIRGWNGLFAPAKLPTDVLQPLYAAVAQASRTPAFRQLLSQLAFDPVDQSQAEFEKVVVRDYERWGVYVKEAGIQPE